MTVSPSHNDNNNGFGNGNKSKYSHLPSRQSYILRRVKLAQLEDILSDLQLVHLQRVLLGGQCACAAYQLFYQLEHFRRRHWNVLGESDEMRKTWSVRLLITGFAILKIRTEYAIKLPNM